MTLAVPGQVRVHLPRHQFRGYLPRCICWHVVTWRQPHEWECPAGAEVRARLHIGQGGTR